MATLLLTGAGGLLAHDLAIELARVGHDVEARTHTELDIAHARSVRATLDDCEPAVVINAAAWSRVDDAEQRPDLAERANALGPEILASACAERGIFLVHFGTDYVFEGTGGRPYGEDDPVGPVNAYARTKLEGERRVRRVLPGRHLLIRVAWLYGVGGRSYLRSILRTAQNRRVLEVVDDQWGNPTWTATVAEATAELLSMDASGTVHVASRDHTDKRTFTEAACSIAAAHVPLAVREIRPVPTSSRGDEARRPPWTVLDTSRYERMTKRTLPTWRASLESFLERHVGELLD